MSAAETLLTWYHQHARDLPWRVSADPYRVWLSEIMLQQTRVETVVPYFERFLAALPTVEALAAASLEEVRALWSGLGYYRRAQQLHLAAQQVAAAGGFPTTFEGWRQLPGIGPYTAAAVSSIAFGVAEPVVDSNVERVITRYRALIGDPKSAAVAREIRAAARELLVLSAPGDSNQALMELGATLCSPRQPRCLFCPLAEACAARAAGEAEVFPTVRKERAAEKVVQRLALVLDGENRVLLFRRGERETLLAGLWELPTAQGEGEVTRELATRYGGRWELGEELARVRHGITYRDLDCRIHRARVTVPRGEVAEGSAEAGWFGPGELGSLPLSAMVDKALKAVGWLVHGPVVKPGPRRRRPRG